MHGELKRKENRRNSNFYRIYQIVGCMDQMIPRNQGAKILLVLASVVLHQSQIEGVAMHCIAYGGVRCPFFGDGPSILPAQHARMGFVKCHLIMDLDRQPSKRQLCFRGGIDNI